MSKKYETRLTCANCNEEVFLKIDKGISVKEHIELILLNLCPRCECNLTDMGWKNEHN